MWLQQSRRNDPEVQTALVDSQPPLVVVPFEFGELEDVYSFHRVSQNNGADS
jgi:hypothetical protein